MTANHDFERRLASYYSEQPPLHAPDWVLQSALTTIDTTRQRRGLPAPRRFAQMNMYAKVAAAAAVVVALGAIGLWQVLSPAQPRPTSSPAPSATLAPTPTAGPTAAAPVTIHNSKRQALSLLAPKGWTTRAATEPWMSTEPPGFEASTADILYDGALEDHLFIAVASQPLAGAAGRAWADTIDRACAPSEPIVVDGAEGRLNACFDQPLEALFW